MKTLLALLCLALALSACGGDARTPTESSPPPPAPADTAAPAPTDTAVPPADEPTALPPTDAPTSTPTEEPTATPTRAVLPRPTATSSGPLNAQFYYIGCRNAPTAEKPGNIVFSFSVEATGGNGVYAYFHRGVEEDDKFIDVEWEKGTRLIGKVTITSGDGQTIEKEYDFATGNLDCAP